MFEKLVPSVRLLLGLIFLAGSINGFLILMDQPPFLPVNQEAIDYLLNTGYLYALVKITELASAIMLLLNRFAVLGTVLLAPVVVNIFFMHLLHDKPLISVGVILILMEIVMVVRYWQNIKPVFLARQV